MQTWVVMNDLQIPFHATKALNLVLGFIEDLRPHGVILNGDIVDCYSISDFDKNPLTVATLSREISLAQSLMLRLTRMGLKERIWIGGNHEDRLRRHVWKNPGLIRSLDPKTREKVVAAMDFPTVFGLGEHDFRWLPYGDDVRLGKLMVTHGSMVSKHSGQTAKSHLERYGQSILIGHTHRGGVHYRRDVRGVHAGYENFCLCRLDPEYIQHPNWQQGFSVVHVESKTGFYHVQPIPILPGNQFFYGDTKVRG